MELLDVLNELQKVLKYKDEELYLYFVEKMLVTAKDKRYKNSLEIVKRELSKPRADKTPNEIWIELGWTTGKLFYQDSFDLHCVLYYSVKYTIFDNVDIRCHKVLIPMFNLEPNYKRGQKSTFHKPSLTYRDFLEKRKEYIETIEKLKEEINE